jgi:hypothetical protein
MGFTFHCSLDHPPFLRQKGIARIGVSVNSENFVDSGLVPLAGQSDGLKH